MSDPFNRPNPNGVGGQPTPIYIKPSDTKAFLCKCGSDTFLQKFWLRTVSPLLGGNGDAEPKPMGVIACEKCGKVVDQLLPPDLRPIAIDV